MFLLIADAVAGGHIESSTQPELHLRRGRRGPLIRGLRGLLDGPLSLQYLLRLLVLVIAGAWPTSSCVIRCSASAPAPMAAVRSRSACPITSGGPVGPGSDCWALATPCLCRRYGDDRVLGGGLWAGPWAWPRFRLSPGRSGCMQRRRWLCAVVQVTGLSSGTMTLISPRQQPPRPRYGDLALGLRGERVGVATACTAPSPTMGLKREGTPGLSAALALLVSAVPVGCCCPPRFCPWLRLSLR